MNIATAPARISQAKNRETVVKMRRLALNMAVMSQVHVAWARLQQARDELSTHQQMREVERRIHRQVQARERNQREGALASIRSALNLVLAELRLDMAYADVQNAMGRLQVSVGYDPLPETVTSYDLPTLTDAIREKMNDPHCGFMAPKDDGCAWPQINTQVDGATTTSAAEEPPKILETPRPTPQALRKKSAPEPVAFKPLMKGLDPEATVSQHGKAKEPMLLAAVEDKSGITHAERWLQRRLHHFMEKQQ